MSTGSDKRTTGRTRRPRIGSALGLAIAILAVFVAEGVASPGFKLPSENTTCAVLPPRLAGGDTPALLCTSTYIKKGAYDGRGAVRLRQSGKAKRIDSGNDLALAVDGVKPDGSTSKRPVLDYGETFRRKGFTCTSRSSGLTCKRRSHGFVLSREAQRYF